MAPLRVKKKMNLFDHVLVEGRNVFLYFLPTGLMDLAAGSIIFITKLDPFINLATISQQYQFCFFNLYLIYGGNIPVFCLTGRNYDDKHKDMKTNKLIKRISKLIKFKTRLHQEL